MDETKKRWTELVVLFKNKNLTTLIRTEVKLIQRVDANKKNIGNNIT